MDKKAQANINALIKLASVYDMYPHATYALRHNENNPAAKYITVNMVRDEDSPVDIDASYSDYNMLMPQRNGYNMMSDQPYMGQYNLLEDRPNIEGTGHGIPLSTRPRNPQEFS